MAQMGLSTMSSELRNTEHRFSAGKSFPGRNLEQNQARVEQSSAEAVLEWQRAEREKRGIQKKERGRCRKRRERLLKATEVNKIDLLMSWP